MKGFCKTARGTTLDSSKAHERQEIIGEEPILAALGREVAAKVIDLSACKQSCYWDVCIRRRKIALIFGNFVLKYEMIAPSIPSEFSSQSMILMPIVQPMRENDIRIDRPL